MNQSKTVSVSVKLQVFFSSFKAKGIYPVAGIACIVNTWLYYFLTMLQASRKGTFSAAFFMSPIWSDLAVMWFARVFACSKENLFSKTLPCSRELGTTYVSLFTEAVNTFTFLVAFVFFLVFKNGEVFIESYYAVLIVFALVHVIVSVSAPFMQAARTTKEKIISYLLPLLIMETATLLVKPLAAYVMPHFARTPALFYTLLAVLLAVSCLINSMLVRRAYEKR